MITVVSLQADMVASLPAAFNHRTDTFQRENSNAACARTLTHRALAKSDIDSVAQKFPLAKHYATYGSRMRARLTFFDFQQRQYTAFVPMSSMSKLWTTLGLSLLMDVFTRPF